MGSVQVYIALCASAKVRNVQCSDVHSYVYEGVKCSVNCLTCGILDRPTDSDKFLTTRLDMIDSGITLKGRYMRLFRHAHCHACARTNAYAQAPCSPVW